MMTLSNLCLIDPLILGTSWLRKQPSSNLKVPLSILERIALILDDYFLNGTVSDEIMSELRTFVDAGDELPESDLFWQAQITLQYLQKGAREFMVSAHSITPVDAEVRPFCTPEVADLIADVLQGKKWHLVREAFLLLQTHEQHLHPKAIPTALQTLHNQYQLWPLWSRVSAQRALWLARKHDSWRWWSSLHQNDKETTIDHLIWLGMHQKSTDVIPSFSAKEWHQYLTAIEQSPHYAIDYLLYQLLKHRSITIRRRSLHLLLQKNDHSWQQAIDNLAMQYARYYLQLEDDQLLPLPILQDHGLVSPEELQDLQLYSEHFKEPIYRLLSLSNWNTVFGAIDLNPKTICRQLVSLSHCRDLAQIAILSLSRSPKIGPTVAMIIAWLDLYPEGNTTSVKLAPLLRNADATQVDQVMAHLLKTDEDEYQMERLSEVLQHITVYLSPSTSNHICRYLMEYLDYGLNQTDRRNIKSGLANLALRLDPKSLLVLKKHWIDEAIYYSQLERPLWKFRDTLESRYDLFLYISGRK